MMNTASLPTPPPRHQFITKSLPSPTEAPFSSEQTRSRLPRIPISPIGTASAPTVGTNLANSNKNGTNSKGVQAPALPPRKAAPLPTGRASSASTPQNSFLYSSSPVRNPKPNEVVRDTKLAFSTTNSSRTLPTPPPSRSTSATASAGLAGPIGSMARKASLLSSSTLDSFRSKQSTLERSNSSNRTSALTMPFSLAAMRKPSAPENSLEMTRRPDFVRDHQKDAVELSDRLSFANKAPTKRSTTSSTAASARKKSENIFTKNELKSIRLAATEAKVNWDDDVSRATSDDTSISGNESSPSSVGSFRVRIGGSRPSFIDRRKPSATNVSTMYGDGEMKKFEFTNPQAPHDVDFGLIVFSGGGGSMVLEEDED